MAIARARDGDDELARQIEANQKKELVRFVVVGSVDDGKSTLIGRLLYESNALYDDQVAQVRRASKQNGLELDFSLFTDGLKAEREQAITIDVAYRYFSTARRKYVIADTPGHAQYTRNMATGASTADAAIILVDARLGIQTQSRRHAYIARLLGIRHLAVAINKMDLVGFDRARFEELEAELSRFAGRLGFASVEVFPVSARGGDNVVTPSPRMPWHQGGTILDYLERVPARRDVAAEAFRFPVQYVLRPHLDYRGFAGQVSSGRVSVGDEVTVLPSGQRTRVKAIDTFEGPIARAFAPMSVTLRLADEVDVSRGDLLVHTGAEPAPAVLEELDAMVVWLGERPLRTRHPYRLRHTTRSVPAQVLDVGWRLELESLEQTPAPELRLNDIGQVRVRCSRPIVADPYTQDRATGSFILIDPVTNATVGAGMILQGERAQGRSRHGVAQVSAAERQGRFGHRAAVLLIARSSDDEAVAVAAAVERALFDLGLQAVFPRGSAEVAVGLAEAGLVAIHAATGSEATQTLARATLRVSGATVIESIRDEPLEALRARVLAELKPGGGPG